MYQITPTCPPEAEVVFVAIAAIARHALQIVLETEENHLHTIVVIHQPHLNQVLKVEKEQE
jgi:hypothetical protein|tara:strand:+ start:215 stop:397 length:183 start_codon:yes stop_codon:yes gene_type:complete